MPVARPALLLTRPRPQAERFAALCRARLGAVEVVISPVLRIVARPDPVELDGVAGVILSSGNAVRVLSERVDVRGLTAWCVGDRTAELAKDHGMRPLSAAGSADDLVALLARERPAGRLLHAHGAETRGDVAGRLRAEGLEVAAATIYDQEPEPLNAAARALLRGPDPVVMPLFSPRSAQLTGQAARGAAAPLALVALSPAVAEAWAGPKPESFTVAARPDAPNMLDSIATIWTSLGA